MIANKRTVLIKHILDTTPTKEIPTIVNTEFKGDYKLYLYTLSTDQVSQIVLNR